MIIIAFYEMPEFERITDPYQPELEDRSYNLTFCLSDYQEHSFDSCPGKRLASQSEKTWTIKWYALYVKFVTVDRQFGLGVLIKYQVLLDKERLRLIILKLSVQLNCTIYISQRYNLIRHLGRLSEHFHKYLYITNCSNVVCYGQLRIRSFN